MFPWTAFICNLMFGFGLTILGAWWSVNVLVRYFVCRANSQPFTSSAFYNCDRWYNVPIESLAKCLSLLMYFLVEMILSDGAIAEACDGHTFLGVSFVPMLWRACFVLITFTEIVLFYNAERVSREAPYLGLIASLYLTGTYFPLFPQEYMDDPSDLLILVNKLYNVVVLVTVVVAILEMVNSRSLALPAVRAGCTILIGFWLMTSAVMFTYFEPGRVDGWRNLKVTALLFCFIALTTSLYVGAIGARAMQCANQCKRTTPNNGLSRF